MLAESCPSSPSTAQVSVRSLAGEVAEFSADVNSSVGALKSHIATLWQVPARCQALVSASVALEDDDILSAFWDPSTRAACLTMLVLSSQVLDCLEDPETRLLALNVVARFHCSDAATLKAVTACLEDHDPGVQSKAVDVLCQSAETGSVEVIDVVASQLEHTDTSVRSAAVTVLLRVPGSNSERVAAALDARVEFRCPHVRRDAVQALTQLVGTARTAKIVASRLSHDDNAVRWGACAALDVLEDNTHAIEAAAACLEDARLVVRKAALTALNFMVGGRGDACAVAAAMSRLGRSNADVRASAVEALAVVAARGDARVVEELSICLEDASYVVRAEAAAALAQVASKGDAVAIRGLVERLDDCEELVTHAARHALLRVANRGDKLTVEAVAAHLSDSHWTVRESALMVLAELSDDEGYILKSAQALIKDPHPRVRDTALMAIQRREDLLELCQFKARASSGNSY